MSEAKESAAPSYRERLQDPRWQQKRLKIFERDTWQCQQCGRADVTLNVHHTEYKRGTMPWDYPDLTLVTLCQPCHTLLGKPKRQEGSQQFVMVFQERMRQLACNRSMTGERFRVFLWLLGCCKWDNWLYAEQKEIALETGMHSTQVSRALRFLIESGIVERGPSLGRAHAYKLNSHYVYKGKVVNLAQHRRREAQRG